MLRICMLTLGCVVMLTGCAKTTVVLLPDENGTVGQVVVQTAVEQCVLTQADQRVDAHADGFSKKTVMSSNAVDQVFGSTLKALPEKPESLLIYFASESTRPTAESAGQLDMAIQNIKARTSPSVELFGHTDSLGDRAYNQNLSDGRAKEVFRLLKSRGVPLEIITVRGFGDRDPLFPSQPGKAEPRNRRVEIFIR